MSRATVDQGIIDAIGEPMLIVEQATTLAANRAALEVLGKDIVGRDVRFAIRHPAALEAILDGRDSQIDLVGIGSSDRPWHLTVRALDKRRVLARLTDHAQFIAAERMRTDFVANASHELRTPLATIIGFGETLSEEAPLDEAMRARFGQTIHDEARRMLRIVEDLMSLSRIEAGRFDLPTDMVDLASIARLSIAQSSQLAAQRECNIELDAPAATIVRGDHTQLLQLTDNLIANALRYGCTPACCSVTVEVRSEGTRAFLVVRDLGEGVAAEQIPRLTERFYRVDAARSRDAGGTGLGLAIVKHIVERHRGTFDFRSRLGAGTMVTVTFPLAAGAVTKM